MPVAVIFCMIFTAGIAADQLLKVWAVQALADGSVIAVIPGFFTLVYVENRGAAFGIFQNATVFFLIMSLVVAAVAVWTMIKNRYFADFPSRLCLTLIVTGGMGNAVDRIVRGFVVDYMKFEFSFFPWVFNLADVFVVCSTIALIGILIFSKEKAGLFKEEPK